MIAGGLRWSSLAGSSGSAGSLGNRQHAPCSALSAHHCRWEDHYLCYDALKAVLELLSGDEFAQEEIPERVHAALAVRDGHWIVDDVRESLNEP